MAVAFVGWSVTYRLFVDHVARSMTHQFEKKDFMGENKRFKCLPILVPQNSSEIFEFDVGTFLERF